MTGEPDVPAPPQTVVAAVSRWLETEHGGPVEVEGETAPTGHVNETVFIDASMGERVARLVAKRTTPDGVVLRRADVHEGHFLQALGSAGARVPPVRHVEVDDDGRVLLVMDRVEGRGVPDDVPTSYVASGWVAELSPSMQAEVWDDFHDALAEVHSASVQGLAEVLGQQSHAEHLEYWRQALLDIADPLRVPVQLAAIDWLQRHAPADVDDRPAICMGDARMANAIYDGARLGALVDWEIAYVGNPAADIAYSLHTDALFSEFAGGRLPGFADADHTWARWEQRSGRVANDRDYWMVHAGIVFGVTASRAIAEMVRADQPDAEFDESMNPLAGRLEDLVPGGL